MEFFADGFDGQAQNDDEADTREGSGSWIVSAPGWLAWQRSVVCGYLYPKMVGLWGWIAGVRDIVIDGCRFASARKPFPALLQRSTMGNV